MLKVNSALILYFTAFILYVFAVLIGSDNLELFTKPIILPSIYYFYYISVRGKIDYLFSFSVFCTFYYSLLSTSRSNSRAISWKSENLFFINYYYHYLHFANNDEYDTIIKSMGKSNIY